jgi:hypothetical protein
VAEAAHARARCPVRDGRSAASASLLRGLPRRLVLCSVLAGFALFNAMTEEGGIDPLLSTLAGLRARRLRGWKLTPAC